MALARALEASGAGSGLGEGGAGNSCWYACHKHAVVLHDLTPPRPWPQHPDYRVGRAMLLERLGRFSEAAEEYGEALPLLRAAGRPVFECLFNRGYCYKWVCAEEGPGRAWGASGDVLARRGGCLCDNGSTGASSL